MVEKTADTSADDVGIDISALPTLLAFTVYPDIAGTAFCVAHPTTVPLVDAAIEEMLTAEGGAPYVNMGEVAGGLKKLELFLATMENV